MIFNAIVAALQTIISTFNGTALSNSNLELAATITDDDLLLGSDITITWPKTDTRFNHCTVKFNNEFENFKEDSASWPPKVSGTFDKGVGGVLYSTVDGWDQVKAGGALLNSVGVWNTAENSVYLTWKIKPTQTGNHSIKFTIDDNGHLKIFNPAGQQVSTLSVSSWEHVYTQTVYLVKDTVYTIEAYGVNTGSIKGIAGTITAPNGTELWSTRDVAYNDIIVKTYSNAIYQAMLAEDGGVLLETEAFEEGITDYYHALARAEEVVRTSRTAFAIEFSYLIKDRFLEPGDYIKVSSEALRLPSADDYYFRVDESKVQDNLSCKIKATRFHWAQLAWNVKDDVYVNPKSWSTFTVSAPTSIRYTASVGRIENSSGTVSWIAPNDDRVNSYIVYMTTQGIYSLDGESTFKEIGRTVETSFNLPLLAVGDYVFGVQSVTAAGKRSKIAIAEVHTTVSGNMPPAPTNPSLAESLDKKFVTISWQVPALRDGTVYSDHQATIVYKTSTNAFTSPQQVAEVSSANSFTTAAEEGTWYYWIANLNKQGLLSTTTYAGFYTFKAQDTVFVDTTPPAAPYNFVATSEYNTITLTWTVPSYTTGQGHKETIVYFAEKVGTTAPTFESATIIARVVESTYKFTGEAGKIYYFWIKEVSRGGGISASAAGPAIGQTAINIDQTVTALNDKLSSSQLTSSLRQRIDLIDAPSTGLVDKVSDLVNTYGNTASASSSASSAALSAGSAATAANLSAQSLADAVIAKVAAENAKDSAATARQAAETARDSTVIAKNSAESASSSASASATQSAASADIAATASTAASSYSNAAADQALQASTSASNASVSASQSATSATTAATASTTASSYAAAAESQAIAAASSAGNALISANQAATSATTATEAASTAESYKQLAASSALSASDSANAALSSSQTASTYSSNASNFATAAETSSLSASASKNSAEQAAQSAVTSATTATAAKDAASTFAASASNYSVTASTYAGSAQTYSESAAQSSIDASGYASSAASTLMQTKAIASGFFKTASWNFDTTDEGWVGSGGTASVTDGILSFASSGTDPILTSPSFSISGKYSPIVRARVKRTGGTSWQGTLYYTTAAHGESESYKKTISDTTVLNDWIILEWDMSAITDWNNNQIAKIRLDLGNTAADSFDIDWIIIGNLLPPESIASSANIANVSWWAPGASLQSGWTYFDTAAETVFVTGADHTNRTATLMQVVAANDAGTSDGGFQNGNFITGIDRTKTYRFVIPVKRTTAAGSFRWRISGANTINTTTSNTSAYFVNTTLADQDNWYLAIGYVFPAGSIDHNSDSAGLFDVKTGKKVATGTNFCWNSSTNVSYGAFQYNGAAGATMLFGKPMIHVMDGSEMPESSLFITSQNITAAVETLATTVAGPDGATAQYTVKVDANGYVAGYGLSSASNTAGTGTSEFTVIADQFSIAPVTSDAAAWVGTTTYAKDAKVQYLGREYVSLQASNLNKNPATQTAWWSKKNTPFFHLTSSQTIDGRTVPAGTYMDAAYITRLTADQIDTRGLSIKDSNGNIILAAGTALDFSNVGGTTKPADNATKNQIIRQTTTPTGGTYSVGDLWIDTDANPTTVANWNGSQWVIISNYTSNTNQLTDGAGLGTTANWSGVADTGGKPQNYATWGAPAGTYVGNIWAQDVESQANSQWRADQAQNNAINWASGQLSNKLNKAGDTISGRINLSVPDGIFAGTDINNGVYMGNGGLVGKKGGNTTFAIDTAGNATFGGTLNAATGIFDGDLSAAVSRKLPGKTWTISGPSYTSGYTYSSYLVGESSFDIAVISGKTYKIEANNPYWSFQLAYGMYADGSLDIYDLMLFQWVESGMAPSDSFPNVTRRRLSMTYVSGQTMFETLHSSNTYLTNAELLGGVTVPTSYYFTGKAAVGFKVSEGGIPKFDGTAETCFLSRPQYATANSTTLRIGWQVIVLPRDLAKKAYKKWIAGVYTTDSALPYKANTTDLSGLYAYKYYANRGSVQNTASNNTTGYYDFIGAGTDILIERYSE